MKRLYGIFKWLKLKVKLLRLLWGSVKAVFKWLKVKLLRLLWGSVKAVFTEPVSMLTIFGPLFLHISGVYLDYSLLQIDEKKQLIEFFHSANFNAYNDYQFQRIVIFLALGLFAPMVILDIFKERLRAFKMDEIFQVLKHRKLHFWWLLSIVYGAVVIKFFFMGWLSDVETFNSFTSNSEYWKEKWFFTVFGFHPPPISFSILRLSIVLFSWYYWNVVTKIIDEVSKEQTTQADS